MKKCEDFHEAIAYLNEGEMLTTKDLDQFFIHKDRVVRRFRGSHYTLSFEDFKELYRDTVFYLYEEVQETVDLEKDEAYYRYYKK
ncbi:MAG: hypothetical protein IKE59_05340 [Erysipelotrichaceae bacterium]|nr:hypothetical protein [Erysipelotrichaceae bacterium]